MLQVAITILPSGQGLEIPKRMTSGSSAVDLRAAIAKPLHLAPGAFLQIPTGIAIALPEGTEGQIRPRSGLAARAGITILNSPGTVDSDFRGELQVLLVNHGSKGFKIERGDRIAQLVVARTETIMWQVTDNLPSSARGSSGFGHTGTKGSASVDPAADQAR